MNDIRKTVTVLRALLEEQGSDVCSDDRSTMLGKLSKMMGIRMFYYHATATKKIQRSASLKSRDAIQPKSFNSTMRSLLFRCGEVEEVVSASLW